MSRRSHGWALICLGGLAGSLVAQSGGPAALHHDARRAPVAGASPYDRAPSVAALAFVENRGQWDTPAQFVARDGGVVAGFEPDAVTLSFAPGGEAAETGLHVRLAFQGSSPGVALEGESVQAGARNYLLGPDSDAWRTAVPAYSSIVYRGLYDGVDMRVSEQRDRIQYDLLLAAGADLDRVVVEAAGVEELSIDERGALVMQTALGPVVQSPPVTWYELPDGSREPVEARFRLIDSCSYGFAVAGRRTDVPMVIDPGLEWSTYLGGEDFELNGYVTVAPNGETVFLGCSRSLAFPTTPGAYDTTFNGGQFDVVVSRISADGTQLVYSTFIGGSGADSPADAAITSSGDVVLCGYADPGFPTTPGAYDTTSNGSLDAFVLRLASGGDQLVYSTFLGGSMLDVAMSVVLDQQGGAVVGGYTSSTNFPTTPGAYDSDGDDFTYDSFVASFSADGSQLEYSTYFGEDDAASWIWSIDIDRVGLITVAGDASPGGVPVTPGAFDTTHNGEHDAYVARLQLEGTGAGDLLYSTYLGGSGHDFGKAMDVGRTGLVAVTGYAQADGGGPQDFPVTAGAYDTSTAPPNRRAYVALLDLAGNGPSDLLYSTFFSGGGDSGNDQTWGTAIALDSADNVTLAGWTSESDLPTTLGAFDVTFNGAAKESYGDGFVARFHPDTSLPPDDQLLYSTFLGGGSGDAIEWTNSVALDGTNAATVSGTTNATDFPVTPGAVDETYNGGEIGGPFPDAGGDFFVSRLDLLPTGVSKYGTSTPACAGPIAAAVTKMPQAGDATFAATSTGGPASSTGFLVVSDTQDVAGSPFYSVTLFVDIGASSTVVWLPAVTDASGYSTTTVDLTGYAASEQLFAQFVWVNWPACDNGLRLSASNALEVTVQP